jgi:predicted nucleic acid-binding protein
MSPWATEIWEPRRSLTAYDAAYVALAETLKAPVMTCDRRLSHATGHAAHVELSAESEV